MKPSELKNISKLTEKRAKIAEDLSMFLATSQVVVLHMRHPKTFETNYEAELWKEQCNKLLDDITMKTKDVKEYLNNETNCGTIKGNRPSLSLKLISRHYTDDDMDHLNPGSRNISNATGLVIQRDRLSNSDNEQIDENYECMNEHSVKNDSLHIDENILKVEPIACQSKENTNQEEHLLEMLMQISDISDNDLEFSDITLGSESEEKPEYINKRKRKKVKKKKHPFRETFNMQQYKRACFVNLIRFDVKLYEEYVAKHKKYRLTSLTEFLKLTKKRKRSPSSSSESSASLSVGSHSPVYYPEAEVATISMNDDGVYDPLLTPYDQRPLNPEDEMIAAMNQISDSDVSGLDSDLDSNSDGAKNGKSEKVKKMKKKRKKIESSDMDSDFEPEIIKPSNSSWRRDPLLRENLDFDEKKTDKKICDPLKIDEDPKEPKEEKSLVSKSAGPEVAEISDDDFVPVINDSTDSVDSDVECLGDVSISPGKGRKNIRPMLHDEALHEATQRANKIEQEKQKRLADLKNSVYSFVMSQSSGSEGLEGLLLDVDPVSMKPIVVVNALLTNRLKDHQQEGVKFMWNACFEKVEMISKNDGSGCILAHCMGLGKTFQVATLVHTLFGHPETNVKHVLIICPLSTVPNWNQEFLLTKRVARCGSFRIFCKSKLKSNIRTIVLQWRNNGGVLILGYDAYHSLMSKKTNISASTAQTLEEALMNPGPDLLVCDEGHLLKNQNKMKYKTVDQIKTKRRILLTGTPMQNNLTEYYYMVQLIKPSLLGTFKEFTNRFNNPIVNGQYGDSTTSDIKIMKQRSHVLHEILKGTVQRYEESELKIYLPSKVDYALYIQMNEVQASLYRDVLNKLRSNHEPGKKIVDIISHYQKLMPFWMHPCIAFTKENNKKPVEYETISADILEDQVIDLTPDLEEKFPLDVETNINYGAKFVVIMAIIEESMKVGDRLLIFSTSLFTLDTIERFLKCANKRNAFQWIKNVSYFRLDGQVLPIDRVDITDKFNDKKSKARLMLMTNKVGGLGLNLVAANRVILADISWNPALDTQSIFRSYRFGQEKQVYIYRLIARGTMEETVYRRAVTKVAIAGRVVDEQQIERHYKSVDLQEIYRFDYKKEEVRPIPKVPADNLLATILQNFPAHVFGYDEHNSLFLNQPDEELNEEEMKEAWVEFNKEKAPKVIPQINSQINPQINPQINFNINLAPGVLNTRYLDGFLPPMLSRIPEQFQSQFLNHNLLRDIKNSNSTTKSTAQSAMESQFKLKELQRALMSRISQTKTAPNLNTTLPSNTPNFHAMLQPNSLNLNAMRQPNTSKVNAIMQPNTSKLNVMTQPNTQKINAMLPPNISKLNAMTQPNTQRVTAMLPPNTPKLNATTQPNTPKVNSMLPPNIPQLNAMMQFNTPKVNAMLPPNNQKVNANTTNLNTIKANKDMWLSKQMDYSMPRLPHIANVLQKHRMGNVAASQNILNKNTLTNNAYGTMPILTKVTNLTKELKQVKHRPNRINLLQKADENRPANTNDIVELDLTLSMDKVIPVNTNKIINSAVPEDANPMHKPPVTFSTNILNRSINRTTEYNREHTITPVEASPTPISFVPVVPAASVASVEDFIVNPFLPTETDNAVEISEVNEVFVINMEPTPTPAQKPVAPIDFTVEKDPYLHTETLTANQDSNYANSAVDATPDE